MRKLPRLKDMFGPDDVTERPARPDENASDTKDTRPVVMGEPMALDMTAVRRSRRHKVGVAYDGSPLVFGEPLPIDRSAITYHPRSASGSLAEDAKPCPPVQGETFPIAD